jgi:hypothetical protein
MKIVVLFYILAIFINCKPQHKEVHGVQNNLFKGLDSRKELMPTKVVEFFKNITLSSLDSAKKNNLIELDKLCIKYLYGLYGNELINHDDIMYQCSNCDSLTVGESIIKLRSFKKVSNDSVVLVYGVFINDTIPTNISIATSKGSMINMFIVSLKQIDIIGISINGETYFNKKNFLEQYNKNISSLAFKQYTSNKRKYTSMSFKKDFPSNSNSPKLTH